MLPSELSEDSIIACQKIAERCFQDTDPTKISHISLPEKTPHYLLKANIPIEMLIALVSRSVFNVCEIVENEEGDFVSLELPLEKIQTKLTFTEVTAEVALQHILFDKKYCDRSFMPDTDRQGKNDNDTFTASVNMRW